MSREAFYDAVAALPGFGELPPPVVDQVVATLTAYREAVGEVLAGDDGTAGYLDSWRTVAMFAALGAVPPER